MDATKMLLQAQAVMVEKEVAEKKESKKHEAKFHKDGFYVTLETEKGYVGLWSCWLGDRLFLGFPKDWEVDDELIKATLDVTESTQPRWGKFYGEIEETGGRVWIEKNNHEAYGHHFPYISNGKYESLYYGHDESGKIATYPFSRYNEETEVEGHTTEEEAILSYRDKFIELAIQIAASYGTIKAIHVKYEDTLLIPELLAVHGYENVTYVEGCPEYIASFGGTILHAKKEKEEIMLKAGNGLVPWVNLRKVEVDGNVTVQDVLDLLVF